MSGNAIIKNEQTRSEKGTANKKWRHQSFWLNFWRFSFSRRPAAFLFVFIFVVVVSMRRYISIWKPQAKRKSTCKIKEVAENFQFNLEKFCSFTARDAFIANFILFIAIRLQIEWAIWNVKMQVQYARNCAIQCNPKKFHFVLSPWSWNNGQGTVSLVEDIRFNPSVWLMVYNWKITSSEKVQCRKSSERSFFSIFFFLVFKSINIYLNNGRRRRTRLKKALTENNSNKRGQFKKKIMIKRIERMAAPFIIVILIYLHWLYCVV